MSAPAPQEVTELLLKWRGGDKEALEELTQLVYPELRRMARDFLRHERPDHTLQPTALTHEAFLRLIDQRRVRWQGRAHFFAIAARMMRRILVDYARRRLTQKRLATQVSLDPVAPTLAGGVDLVDLHEALLRLEEMDPRQGRIVELRYFGGLTVEETGEVLSLSPATVKREWSVAKRWLRHELNPA